MSTGPIYPPNPDLPGPPMPPPVDPPVVVAQCLVCFHKSETTCDMCGGKLGTSTLPPCKACPNGLVIA